jgi:hypothetical protein
LLVPVASRMNRQITRTLTLLLAVSALGAPRERPAKLLSKTDIVGVWAGFGKEYPYFYRLNLRPDNAGSLVVLYPEANPDVYRVVWAISNSTVVTKMTPFSPGAEPIDCSVAEPDSRRMGFIVKGISAEFTRTALLVNQERFARTFAESTKYDPYAGEPKKEKRSGP